MFSQSSNQSSKQKTPKSKPSPSSPRKSSAKQRLTLEALEARIVPSSDPFFGGRFRRLGSDIAVMDTSGSSDSTNPPAGPETFTVGANFTAVTIEEQSNILGANSIPPDTMGAVGPNHVVVILNGSFSLHDRTGTRLEFERQDSFWTTALTNSNNPNPTVDDSFDPRILFDPASDRWFAVAVEERMSDASSFLVGVTTGNDPSLANWRGFRIDADSGNEEWADFPTIGLDDDALYISANMVMGTDGFASNVTVVAIPKADLTALNPTVAGAVKQENIDVNANNNGFSLQPAVDLTGSGLPLPVLSGSGKTSGQLRISEFPIDFFPSVTLSAGTSIVNGVTARNQPDDAAQPNPGLAVDTGDTRFSGNVVIQDIGDGNGPTLWAVHTVDNGARTAVEWYQINFNTNTVLQSGLISDSNLDLYYPSIAVNQDGEAVIGLSGSASDTFVSTYLLQGETVGGVTTFGNLFQTRAGEATYNIPDSGGRNRWGDYSATVIDPLDHNTFWTFQEYAAQDTGGGGDNWAVQVTQLTVDSPGVDTVEVTLDLRELDTTPGLVVGEQFAIDVSFRDIANNQAVFSGYADINFDPSLLRVDEIIHVGDYQNNTKGLRDNVSGVVNEVGGESNQPTPGGETVFTLLVSAIGSGSATVSSNAGEELDSVTALFGSPTVDQRDNTIYGDLGLTIGAAPADLVELTMVLEELDGTPGIVVGEQFEIDVHFRDIINDEPVASGYADITFDPALIRVDNIVQSPEYGFGATGTINNNIGEVGEVGSFANIQTSQTDTLVFTLEVTALAAGNLTVQSNAGEDGLSQTTIFTLIQDLRNNTIYGNLPLTINEDVPPTDADLSLDKTVSNPTPFEGETVTFTLTLSNGGPLEATTVQVTDVLPGDMTFVSSNDASYDPATNDNVWNIANLASGASVQLEIAASVNAGTQGLNITNTAEVTFSNVPDPDSDPGNGVPTEDDQDSATIMVQAPPEFQIVEGVDDQIISPAGSSFTAQVQYDVSDGDNTLNGLTVRMHFNPNFMTFDGANNLLTPGNVFQQPTLLPDDMNLDNDDLTTMMVQISWLDVNSQWPNVGLPANLFDADFTLNAGLTEGQTSNINFTGIGSGTYVFQGNSKQVEVGQDVSLDVDGNGSSEPFSDGFLILRHLIGGFPGNALTNGALGAGATRTDPAEITAFLEADDHRNRNQR